MSKTLILPCDKLKCEGCGECLQVTHVQAVPTAQEVELLKATRQNLDEAFDAIFGGGLGRLN